MAPTRTRDDNDAAEDSLARIGRQLTRVIDMFWSPIDVLTLGKQVHQMSGQALLTLRQTATPKQKRVLALLDKLNELDPALIPRLVGGGSHTGILTRDAKKQLRIGQSNGKSEDMRKVKGLLGSWRSWNPPLPDADDKVNRGNKHKECAYLLSDPSINWEDEEARRQFMVYGNPPPNPSLWGRFLRPYGQYNPSRPSDGLLRGELMISAARAILFSPAASKIGTMAGARGNKRPTQIGLSKTYQLTEVTPAFIAYVAVVLRHSLTSDETFSETCAGFDYIDFYEQIREYLEAPQFARRVTLLLDWWNRQLFAEYRLGLTSTPPDLHAVGTLASLEAELEGEEDEEAEAEAEQVAVA